MQPVIISDNIFNIDNNYSSNDVSLFLQGKHGLIDSIHKKHPAIWDLYKKMKSLDWDENEFDYSSCVLEFKTCSKVTYEMMIKTLAWQWEADSIAAYNLIPIVAPFVSSTELWALWTSIGSSELLHALTYSEIVRNSFESPDEVLEAVLGEAKALQRLEVVSKVFNDTYEMSHKLSLGLVDKDASETYDSILIFTVTMLILERVQFMGSFSITFAIVDTGLFLPIGKAVQKIATDELQVHVKANKEVIKNELKTSRGFASYSANLVLFKKILDDVVNSELEWTDYMFSDNRELVGLTKELVKDWILFNANDVYAFLNIDNDFKLVEKNPLGYMNDWLDINNNQPSPQEEKTGNYLLGGMKDTTKGKMFSLDFL